jgi:hypothetical protein
VVGLNLKNTERFTSKSKRLMSMSSCQNCSTDHKDGWWMDGEGVTGTERDATRPEPRRIDIDGRSISIRLMDTSYVMCEDERQKGVELGIHCRQLSPHWPNPLYATYYRKLLDAYAVGPVFVWDARRKLPGISKVLP